MTFRMLRRCTLNSSKAQLPILPNWPNVRDGLESYAHQPRLGESRSELGREVRGFSVERYVVYYKPITEGIELIRVLHGSRDVRQL